MQDLNSPTRDGTWPSFSQLKKKTNPNYKSGESLQATENITNKKYMLFVYSQHPGTVAVDILTFHFPGYIMVAV